MSIADNLACVREKIALAESRAGRAAGSVRLMAVSKFHPASSVLEAVDAGQTLFGENRVQESVQKFPHVFAASPGLELHLIGSLQRNKVRQILPLAFCIQSVDRSELLAEIEKQAGAISRKMNVMFELHTAEDSKSGYADTDSLFRSIDLLESMPHIVCSGLMTMAPFTGDIGLIRKSFRTLCGIRDECRRRYPSVCFDELSMGMSSDFEVAIEEGSTLVRIGTAVFGERP
jgi:pyridoxal phosphate enzyme (YggS family)